MKCSKLCVLCEIILLDCSSLMPNCWTKDGTLTSARRTQSTFLWDVRDFLTRNVCSTTQGVYWNGGVTPQAGVHSAQCVWEEDTVSVVLTPGGSLCRMCSAVAWLIDSWSQTGTVSRRRSSTLMLLRDPRPLWGHSSLRWHGLAGSGKS